MGGARAASQQNEACAMVGFIPNRSRYFHHMRIGGELSVTIENCNLMPLQLILYHRKLPLDHFGNTKHQIFNLNLGLDPVALAIERPLTEAAQKQHRLAQGLARDGAGVQADATEVEVAVDDGDGLAFLGRLHCGMMSSGSAPDNKQVEIEGICFHIGPAVF